MIHNNSIIPKKKALRCGHFDYNFSKGRCKTCATLEDTQKRIAKHEEQEEDESFMNLVDDLDAVFSRYIRLKYSNEKGLVRCYTSSVEMRYQDAQCGHYVSRKNYATRWMELNCRVQSKHDNEYLHGNLEVFRRRLNEEQHGLADWLEEQGRTVCKPTREELKAMIIDYRYKVKLLENKIKKQQKQK